MSERSFAKQIEDMLEDYDLYLRSCDCEQCVKERDGQPPAIERLSDMIKEKEKKDSMTVQKGTITAVMAFLRQAKSKREFKDMIDKFMENVRLAP